MNMQQPRGSWQHFCSFISTTKAVPGACTASSLDWINRPLGELTSMSLIIAFVLKCLCLDKRFGNCFSSKKLCALRITVKRGWKGAIPRKELRIFGKGLPSSKSLPQAILNWCVCLAVCRKCRQISNTC